MYIYKLKNFFENESLLFSERGKVILGYGYSYLENINSTLLDNKINGWIWRMTKEQTVRYSSVYIKEVRLIDFNKLPDNIQGLFLLNKITNIKLLFDMVQIKQALGHDKWKKFLSYSTRLI